MVALFANIDEREKRKLLHRKHCNESIATKTLQRSHCNKPRPVCGATATSDFFEILSFKTETNNEKIGNSKTIKLVEN